MRVAKMSSSEKASAGEELLRALEEGGRGLAIIGWVY